MHSFRPRIQTKFFNILQLLKLQQRGKSKSKSEAEFERKLNEEVFIMSAVRTPIGSFGKSLSAFSAPQLGAVEAVEKSGFSNKQVQEVYMGNGFQGGVGQAPARQAAIFAGLPPDTVDCTTINKLEASGMKSIILGTLNLKCGDQQVMVAGGMESMSNIVFYLKRGYPTFGGMKLHDGIIHDCQTNAYNQVHIGSCAEKVAKTMKITREQQDAYALCSYRKRAEANEKGVFKAEVVPVKISQGKGKKDTEFSVDEERKTIDPQILPKLPTLFKSDHGTITSGNASSINDGAAAVVLATESAVNTVKTKPLARIVGFQDAATDPMDFCRASVHAIQKILERNNIKKEDIALWEIDEGFGLIAIVNKILLEIDPKKVNVHGGSVSLGHPIGMTGTRMVVHLCHALNPGDYGMAAICNGGGGASAILIQRI
ncbi:unnamed protein product [Orchesella dallaii]|uniref:acetyl-CoA C-acetyltransferase n=1 Tax=Orchesella dallaii TaxID=48710 RepID=A0ABP1PQH7_9HEXA